jgi:uncharacterized protein (TIGR00725 family)
MRVLPIVGVVGSGSEPHAAQAELLGRVLAEEAVHLLTGGGGGVMEGVSRAFATAPGGRLGLVLAVLPGSSDDGRYQPRPGYPNRWVELVIRTHLPLSGITGTSTLSRNHINVLSSDAVIALPGGAGTRSEVLLALGYGKPVLGFMDDWRRIAGLDRPIPLATEAAAVRAFLRRVLRGGA